MTLTASPAKKLDNVVPVRDKVIVRRDEQVSKTPGGIILPDVAQEKPRRGKVLSVGEGRLDDKGNVVPMSVREGDTVLFSSYSGYEIELGGEKVLIMGEGEILAIIR